VNRLITREQLRDGSQLAEWRASALPGSYILTDEEIDASLRRCLSQRPVDADVWIFGYGSLIWNPAFEFVEKDVSLMQGWHRRFCIWTMTGRGSPETPGLALALDRGGSCKGIAFRLKESTVEEELTILWRREMVSGVYEARWIDAELRYQRGKKIRVLAFVANRQHARFTNTLSGAQIADRIMAARGSFGSNLEYFTNTFEHLKKFGIRDTGLDRIKNCIPEAAGQTIS
jgi:glutathione-specific gamma-glutamylcyclotransferase